MKKLLFLLVLPLMIACSPEETIYLDEMNLDQMTSGWGRPQVNRSITDNPLMINGQQFERGIGTHAISTYLIQLGGNGVLFSSMVGVDDASDSPSSVKFYLVGDGEVLWESPLMTKGMPAVPCEVSLSNIDRLGMLVTNGGDGIDFDHANWAEAMITYKGEAPAPVKRQMEEPYLLTPPAPDHPRINSAEIIGARPGSPVLFRIPATGKEPLSFFAEGLPDGLFLEPGSRIIKGSLTQRGDYAVKLIVSNAFGEDTKELTFRIGDTLALTPHMGWNSWYIHYHRVSDSIMRQAADQLIESGMADYGYQYVNIDDCWMVKVDSDDPIVGGATRDGNGKILTNKRFPDMKGLTDYIHSNGLLAGTYISPGPKTCMNYAGSYGHEAQDAKTFAEWGFDFLKYDWCSYGRAEPPENRADYVAPYQLMWDELKKQNRDIVHNLCQYGMSEVWEWGGQVGNSWRTTGDLGVERGRSMPGFYYIGRSNADHWEYARPGNWNDPDYILIGWVGSAFKLGEGVQTDLSPNEQYFYMSMWSLMAAPLIFSGDMSKLDPFTLNILCNHEVIEVNQDKLGVQGRILREGKGEMVMVKPLSDGSLAVGLFHVTGDQEHPAGYFDWDTQNGIDISLSWDELGFSGPAAVRDVWRQQDLGTNNEGITLSVPYHGVQMLRIYPDQKNN